MSSKRVVRTASHAGSWYSADKAELDRQLDQWLDAVRTPLTCIGPLSEDDTNRELPIPGARVIIAPHAGYSYSGPTAAYAYKTWDLSNVKRVFLLGPSHHFYLANAALTRCTHYATPLGDLVIDTETTQELSKTGQFDWMAKSTDEDEHSLEMHLPYIYKMMSRQHESNPAVFPAIVPILIGNTSAKTEARLGRTLAPYLADPGNAFVISSDFAHWGTRFRYTYYKPSTGPAKHLSASQRAAPQDPTIHDSIKDVDYACMGECESGKHDKWLDILDETGNTVCGRHPIGVIMAAAETLPRRDHDDHRAKFKFVSYERSSLVRTVNDSSVSYASAFAVV